MKKLSMVLVSIMLSALMAFQLPVQVVSAAESSEYISEVKIFMAEEEKDAKSALQSEGYTLLDCNLNQDAEGGVMSKGKKATYLGYKTTKKSREAITDLAVMNMKGGYSTEDYESLMDQYIYGEIEPFLDNFLSAIKEYRTNYTSKNSSNQKRAQVVHDMLNKFTDDDTGKQIGDLLLNESKYEMGDSAYEKLSDDEKSNTADLVTIFAQANGQSTLVMENLITRGSDTSDDTWIDRFSETTYDDLIEMTGKTPTDAKQELAKKYDDDANTIVDDLWKDFKDELESYEDAKANVESYDSSSYEAAIEAVNGIDDNTSEEEEEEILDTFFDELEKYNEYVGDLELLAVRELLGDTDYEDGTLLDFFTQDTSDEDFDITCVYPLVASLTAGQRSGIDFVSLRELCCMAITDEDGYNSIDTDSIPEASIYDGVDRDIYEPGGVAVTNDALRTDAAGKLQSENSFSLSTVSIVMWCITGALNVGFAASASAWSIYSTKLDMCIQTQEFLSHTNPVTYAEIEYKQVTLLNNQMAEDGLWANTKLCRSLTIGFSIATILMSLLSLYCTFVEMQEYYNVDLTPQPRYIVEETDITGYNKKGEKIVIKNQSAYYKIVQTNRSEDAEFYESLGTGNDLNGDVASQWLTLYSVRMEGHDPILASSLKAVVDSKNIPAGYETGIHMFGEDSAYNLNNTSFVWNSDAPSIYVYYKTDDSEASAAGSSFTMGLIALFGGIGLIVGAGLTAIIITVVRKKKAKKA